MTLLNTMANLGGTWPASFVMWLLGQLTPSGNTDPTAASSSALFGGDPYTMVQTFFSVLGIFWILFLGPVVRRLAALPDDAWRTHLLDGDDNESKKGVNKKSKNKPTKTTSNLSNSSVRMGAMESGIADLTRWKEANNNGKLE